MSTFALRATVDNLRNCSSDAACQPKPRAKRALGEGGGVDGTRSCSREAEGVARLDPETAHADTTERSEGVAGWTGLEPSSPR